MRPRFSIAGLAAFIALSGIAFASIRSPSQLWASTLFALALGSLVLGLLNALYSRDRARAYWVGFTTCGALYFMTTLGPWFRDEWGPRMVSTAALDLLYTQVSPATAASTLTNTGFNWIGAINTNSTTNSQIQVLNGIVTSSTSPPGQAASAVIDTEIAPPATSALPVPATLAPLPAATISYTITSTQKPDSFKARWAAWTEPDRVDGVGWQIGQFSLQSTAPFRRIGHSLLTFLFAGLGGAYAARRFEKLPLAAPGIARPVEPA